MAEERQDAQYQENEGVFSHLSSERTPQQIEQIRQQWYKAVYEPQKPSRGLSSQSLDLMLD